MSHQDTRAFRISQIQKSIKKGNTSKTSVVEEKLIAYFCSQFHCSRRTILEYLKELELTDKIVREGGFLIDKKTYDKELQNDVDSLNSVKQQFPID